MADEVVYHDAPKTEDHSDATTVSAVKVEPEEVESTDRGLFGHFGKKDDEKKCEEAKISSEFEAKVHVSEPGEKKESLLEKLRRSDSSSSSSSDEEEGKDGEKKKKKKGLKEKIEGHKEEKIKHDTDVPVEKCDEVVAPHPTYDHGPSGDVAVHQTEPTLEPEEKKGFIEKIKEKLPGGHKKTEEEYVATTPPPPPPASTYDAAAEGEQKEKKGIFEKIKEKIPGYHGKSEEVKNEKENE